jgi:GGDEF domain-containing protein
MTDCSGVDRRMLPGLLAGLVGLTLGVMATVIDLPVLGIGAAACALFAGGASVFLLQRLQESERDIAGAADDVTMRHLEVLTSQGNRSVVDDETGLPDRRFFELALDGRVASARRHLWPLTLVLVEVWIGDPSEPAVEAPTPAIDGIGQIPPTAQTAQTAQTLLSPLSPLTPQTPPAPPTPAEPTETVSEVLADFALLVRRTLREADIACRVSDATFGLILEDTSEEGGVWTAERLQIGLARNKFGIRRMAAGIASYPTHGMRADEILLQARAALDRACAAPPDQGLGPVEVAHVDFG